VLRTMAIHAFAHMTEYKGSNKSKQWMNRCFNTIYSGKYTVKQWYCYNCIELWLEFRFGRNPWKPLAEPRLKNTVLL